MRKDVREKIDQQNKQRPKRLTEIKREDWPSDRDSTRIKVYHSQHYLVQIFKEPVGLRLSINRTKLLPSGRWDDGLTWDELQRIKFELGYGDCQAIEFYPASLDVVNSANMRHLWILKEPLSIGFKFENSNNKKYFEENKNDS